MCKLTLAYKKASTRRRGQIQRFRHLSSFIYKQAHELSHPDHVVDLGGRWKLPNGLACGVVNDVRYILPQVLVIPQADPMVFL